MRYLALILSLFVCGCSETKSDRQADTVRDDTWTASGTIALPVTNPTTGTTTIVPVPVDLTVSRHGTERLVEHTEAKTQIDGAAIAQQLGGVLGKTMDAAIARLTGLQSAPPTSPWMPKPEAVAAVGALGLWGVREMLNARAHKKDADEGWNRAEANAKQIRPEDIGAPLAPA